MEAADCVHRFWGWREGTLYICHLTQDEQYQEYKPYASDKLMQTLLFFLDNH
jgi:hypothetical protein